MNVKKNVKTAFFCSQCGAEHARWQGQCRECSAWNSLIEEKVVKAKITRRTISGAEAVRLPDIGTNHLEGYRTGIDELDRVMGGQLLPGMTVLLGGEPGIGKSTLVLQAAESFSRQGLKVLYVTGEESLSQLKIRSTRLHVRGENITALNSTSLEEILDTLQGGSYNVALIDSIQTVASGQFDSPPGTIAQLRETAHQLISFAKAKALSLLLIGHVTKDGLVAGPKLLEHMVDTVIYFEGDSTRAYRLLRATKNRFGSVAEIGLFEMQAEGLVEVKNPSSLFLSDHYRDTRTGAVVTAICEGNRPLLVELQALVTSASYGTPQRVAGGIDNKRLSLLLAILEKRCGYPMGTHDVFASVAGGIKLSEPAFDLAMLLAIVSSLLNKPVDSQTIVVGEVGLSGEVRAVSLLDRRLSEAARLGFNKAIAPVGTSDSAGTGGIEVHNVKSLQDAIDIVFG